MCTPIWQFKLTITIIDNHDNSLYIVYLYTVSTTDSQVIMFLFLISSLVYAGETFLTER